jgi:hypothetical protein
MVVDHVKKCRETMAVTGIDETLEAMRSAIAVLRRIRMHTIVSPVACAGKLGHRHDFDRRHTQLAQRWQPRYNRIECAFGCECTYMQLIKYEVFARDAAPARISPMEFIQTKNSRRPGDTIRLPTRGWIRPLGASIQTIGITSPASNLFLLKTKVPTLFAPHRVDDASFSVD